MYNYKTFILIQNCAPSNANNLELICQKEGCYSYIEGINILLNTSAPLPYAENI